MTIRKGFHFSLYPAFTIPQSLSLSWKEGLLNSQLNTGLQVAGHPQAIQRKTTRGNGFKSSFTSLGFKNNSAFVCYR
jgi:hypothetical protein